MYISKSEINRVRTLICVVQNKDKKDACTWLEGYLQALEDFRDDTSEPATGFQSLVDAIKKGTYKRKQEEEDEDIDEESEDEIIKDKEDVRNSTTKQ